VQQRQKENSTAAGRSGGADGGDGGIWSNGVGSNSPDLNGDVSNGDSSGGSGAVLNCILSNGAGSNRAGSNGSSGSGGGRQWCFLNCTAFCRIEQQQASVDHFTPVAVAHHTASLLHTPVMRVPLILPQ
jgi:hypothetical protein